MMWEPGTMLGYFLGRLGSLPQWRVLDVSNSGYNILSCPAIFNPLYVSFLAVLVTNTAPSRIYVFSIENTLTTTTQMVTGVLEYSLSR